MSAPLLSTGEKYHERGNRHNAEACIFAANTREMLWVSDASRDILESRRGGGVGSVS
jgi:hypothetical protein